jgi:tetratricopeptide (TPR) repeat protein
VKSLLLCTALLAAAPRTAAAADEPAPQMIDPDTEVARRHFELGSRLYEQGQYAAGIVEFKAANEAKPHADYDYNIARCYDRLGDWPNALDYYQRYLASPDATQTEDVQQRVATLKERTRRPFVPPAPPPPPRRLRVPAIVVGAAAVVALAAGGGLYGSARAELPSRRAYCASLPRDCVPSEWADLSARANGAYALFTIGAALAAADVVLWVIDTRRARAAHRASIVPAPAGLLVRF